MTAPEPSRCLMCPLPAVGYSPFCSEDCSEAWFAREPASEEECECCGEQNGYHDDECIYAEEDEEDDWYDDETPPEEA